MSGPEVRGMNKSYRSIWNASLGCYVAAPESAVAHAAGVSSSRTERRAAPKRACAAMALEARIVFDGAMVETAIVQDAAPAVTDSTEAAPEVTEAPAPVETVSDTVTDDTATDTVVVAATPTATTDRESDTSAPASDTASVDTQEAPALLEPAPATSNEVVFVDGRVTDASAFQSAGREVVILNLEQDGLAQIASALSGRTDITAIHIVSHGSDGVLTLGSTEVTTASIQSTQQDYLQSIGQSLTADGDILVYACDYASGAAGQASMQLLADITGADIAASTDATGDESLGGDWSLEQSTGAIEAAALAPTDWIHALDFSFTPASSTGALGMAQSIMGDGVTVISATYQGGGSQAGTFTAGSGVSFGSNVLSFSAGALLSTSNNAALVAGPNSAGGFGEDATSGVENDATLNALSGGYQTHDAAILDITFVPDVPPGAQVGDVARMTIEVVFGSEEYLEYINSGYNDVMAVIVNGVNQSLVPNASGGESSISIDSVNNTQNQSLFVDNTGSAYNTQMDGFTRTIPLVFDVIVGQQNTLRLAVADTGDAGYDSWMFIRADSAQTVVVAEDDTVTTAANLPITVDLTANDYNLAGASMTLTQIQGQAVTQGQTITLTSGVQVTVGSGGQVTITGNGTSAAHDTFTYQVSNGLGGVATATVDVNVTAPNTNPPVAHNDAEAVLADATLSDNVLVDNGSGADTDPNGDALTVVQVNLTEFTAGSPVTLPSGALLTMNANGTYVYDPNGQFDGLADGATTTDSFTYTITDGHGGNSTATVTVTVTGVASNHAPVAGDDSVTVGEDDAALLVGIRSNDSDADGNPLTLVPDSTTGSAGGAISQDENGNLVFIPGSAFNDLAAGQTRTTSFTYTLWDDQGASDTATVTVTVQGANDAPVAVDDSYDVGEDGGWSLGSPLLNDSDPDSSHLYFSLNGYSGSNGGSFSMDDGGNLIFIPGSSFDDLQVGQSRETQFSYTAYDDQGAGSAAVITIRVHGVNDAPVGAADSYSVYEDGTVVLGSPGVNDTDVDGGTISVDITASGAGDNGGSFSFDDAGNLVFAPGSDFNDLGEGESRLTSFTYTLFDGQGGTAQTTVTVQVLGLNDAPVAVEDRFDAHEDVPMMIGSLLANDTDADGDDMYLLLNSAAGTGGGQFVVDDGGALYFIPAGDFDTLQEGDSLETDYVYTVYDDFGGTSQGLLTLTVHGVNDNPVGWADQYEAYAGNITSLGDPLANDTDVEGDSLSIDRNGVWVGSHGGVFSVDDSGSVIFDPAGAFDDLAEGEFRETSFVYSLHDDHGGVAYATLTVTVRPGTAPVVMGSDSEAQGAVLVDPGSYANEVVFVDSRVPDPQSFALNGREVVVLDAQQDGLEQIAAALNGRTGVATVHIISHGGDGYLTLGQGAVDANALSAQQVQALQALSQVMTADGDILIYACDFASTATGQQGLVQLAQYSQADVAASLDTTGHGSLGGDWSLEATVGSVEAQALAPVGWIYTLAQPAVQAPHADSSVMVATGAQEAQPAVAVATVASAVERVVDSTAPATAVAAVAEQPNLATLAPATRMTGLEAVFRDTLTSLRMMATPVQPATDTHMDRTVWTPAAIETTQEPMRLVSDTVWHPLAERLDDSLVDELALRQMQPAGEDVDALVQPRHRAAPGFAAQLARASMVRARVPARV